MLVIPELNLNKHPKDVKNYSLVDAENMAIDNDSLIIHTENSIIEHNLIQLLKNRNITPNIIYILSCNTEIVIFNKTNNNTINLYRYDEITDSIVNNVDIKVEYSGGKIIGTFTYNKEHLIIAFSEYDCPNNIKVPLKVIDLNSSNINTYVQPICPEIRIPKCESSYINGNANKGWYYIFIRYKIDNNNYTQWFNTNESFFLDSYNLQTIINYGVTPGVVDNNNIDKFKLKVTEPTEFEDLKGITWTSGLPELLEELINLGLGINNVNYKLNNYISNDTDIANLAFKLTFNNLDSRYNKFQIGYINVTKTSTKSFRTDDIKFDSNKATTFEYNKNKFITYNTIDLINSYINYYDVKTLATYNNTLYIANYKEKSNYDDIAKELKNITLNITANLQTIPEIDIKNNEKYTKTILNSASIMNREYYNFFIHFIDKYGQITQGFNIGLFNINLDVYIKQYKNNLNNTLIYVLDGVKSLNFTINSINSLPKDYIGWFVSYEQFERTIIYKGYYVSKDGTFYTDKLNVDSLETIDFGFNKVITKDGITETEIKNKEYFVADAYNNILDNTYIKIKPASVPGSTDGKPAYLIKDINTTNDNIKNIYNKNDKILIPCSDVTYSNQTIANTKNAFVDYIKATLFQRGLYYDNATNVYKKGYNDIYVIKDDKWYYLVKFINLHYYIDYVEIPNSSWKINNKPIITFFPTQRDVEANRQRFFVGNIVELKNTIDLYKQDNFRIYDAYPKTLSNYNEKNEFLNNFPKTIRRSNIIKDESNSIEWRFFDTNSYKNIIENKGDIIKITDIGNIFLVHTQHSLFQFRADSSIRTNENKDIVLGNNDIWDIHYKEVFTSNYGYAGINKQEHAINGIFGYIFYEQDKSKFYRYDNNSIKQIDENINNYIVKFKNYDVNFIDDIINNRLIIIFTEKGFTKTILSYNYKYDVFVSRHTYNINKGYNTKNKTYLIRDTSKILKYDEHNFNNYGSNSKNKISILVNTSYEEIKILEYFKYKLNKIIESTDTNKPQDIRDSYYSGELLNIISEECNTDNINIYINNPKQTINSVKDYNKPYRELGVWNYNFIRNNSTHSPIKEMPSNLSTRFYGNWFVITFVFTQETINNNKLEIESIECSFSKNLT